jgi:ferritin-like metal-binding protein YciE
MKTLRNLFLEELADIYDAEQRIAKALPTLAQAATDARLREAFDAHLRETENHVVVLEQVFRRFGESPRSAPCEATVGLLKEAAEIADENAGAPTLNAALIAAVQKVEHYEIASYGCLHAWAEMLGNPDAASALKKILVEEKGADDVLNELARRSCNQEACAAGVN